MIFATECNGCGANVKAKLTGKLIGASRSETGRPIFPTVEILEQDCTFEERTGCRLRIEDKEAGVLDNYLEDMGIYG